MRLEKMLLEMNGYAITVQRKRIKNINLRINRTGEVKLSAPIQTPIHTLKQFILDKQSWIESHLYKLQHIEKKRSFSFSTGELVSFLGKRYPLEIHMTSDLEYMELKNDCFHLFVKSKDNISKSEQLLKKWYTMQMGILLPPLICKWESIMNVQINRVSIKSMTSRWGSCQPVKKHITINLTLLEKPIGCLEYVLVHEFVHLFEPSHNKRFYSLMDKHLPNWKEHKSALSSIF